MEKGNTRDEILDNVVTSVLTGYLDRQYKICYLKSTDKLSVDFL